MNIFITNTDPVKSATDLPDKLLVKMVLETAQILCTAHRELDGDQYADRHNLYKAAYTHHPAVNGYKQILKLIGGLIHSLYI